MKNWTLPFDASTAGLSPIGADVAGGTSKVGSFGGRPIEETSGTST